jgi:hypothetical protein
MKKGETSLKDYGWGVSKTVSIGYYSKIVLLIMVIKWEKL